MLAEAWPDLPDDAEDELEELDAEFYDSSPSDELDRAILLALTRTPDMLR